MAKQEAPKERVDIRAVNAPPRAAAAGYTNLVFEDDFGQLSIAFGENKGERWNAGLWWDQIPPKTAYTTSGTALTITAPDEAGRHYDLCTQWHNLTTTPDPNAGIRFEPGGYFEARIRGYDWCAFWLFCWNRPWNYGNKINPSDPMTWTNELDILETDGGYPNWAWGTLHKNTSSEGGVADAQNWPNICKSNNTLVGEWHNYGLLWEKTLLTWFVDGVPYQSVAPYESTWQPVQMILTAGAGGVGGSPSKTHPPTISVDWVRVWQGTPTKAEAEPTMQSADTRRSGPKK